ncbi:hypothetical protein [Lactovum odontotermitis]
MGEEKMANYPKCIKAEMLPGPKLWCTFDNGAQRYFPINDQILLEMNPYDLRNLKETHGANLFIAGAMTWIGNEILIEDNGDVRVNKEVIPADIIWKYGTKHLNSANPMLLEKKSEIKHPIWEGVKSLGWLWLFFGILILMTIIFLLNSLR